MSYGAIEKPTDDETRAGGTCARRRGFAVGIVAALALLGTVVATFDPGQKNVFASETSLSMWDDCPYKTHPGMPIAERSQVTMKCLAYTRQATPSPTMSDAKSPFPTSSVKSPSYIDKDSTYWTWGMGQSNAAYGEAKGKYKAGWAAALAAPMEQGLCCTMTREDTCACGLSWIPKEYSCSQNSNACALCGGGWCPRDHTFFMSAEPAPPPPPEPSPAPTRPPASTETPAPVYADPHFMCRDAYYRLDMRCFQQCHNANDRTQSCCDACQGKRRLRGTAV
mmetsp:Transcript_5933/g.17512  ORF Transcript_5933/g.17512 Transcript_5933/m.17512 type:complete len:280 (+) Transcript_5933:161-1000(+)